MNRLIRLLIFLSLLLAMPTLAQDDEEEEVEMTQQEMIAYVASSLEMMNSIEAYFLDGDVTITQDVTTGEANIVGGTLLDASGITLPTTLSDGDEVIVTGYLSEDESIIEAVSIEIILEAEGSPEEEANAEEEETEAEAEEEDPDLTTVEGEVNEFNGQIFIGGERAIVQDGAIGGLTISTVLSQDIESQISYVDGILDQVNTELVQSIDLGEQLGTGSLTLNIRAEDATEAIYLQASETSGLLSEIYSNDWVILGTEEAEAYNAVLDSPEALVGAMNEVLTYVINEETVFEIEDNTSRRRNEIDGDPIRRFDIDLVSAEVYADIALEDLFDGVDAEALGLTPEEVLAVLLEDAELHLEIYISRETDLVRRVDVEFNFSGTFTLADSSIITLEQAGESSYDFEQLNESFTVELPE
jgi:hypothetical protein